MSKTTIIVLVVVFLAIVVYARWGGTQAPQEVEENPIRVGEVEILGVPEDTREAGTKVIEGTEPGEQNSLKISGILTGFGDEEDQFSGSYKVLLIDDGTEIISVDLRPLVSYDVTDLEEQLGVALGTMVTAEGSVEEDGTFVVDSVE